MNLESTVLISTQFVDQKGQGTIFGGGTLLANNFVLTNYHLSLGVSPPEITLRDWRMFIGKSLVAEPFSDVAVLKIEGNNLPFAQLGDSSLLEVGQEVNFISHARLKFFQLKTGRISCLGKILYSTINVNGESFRNPIVVGQLEDVPSEEGDCGSAIISANQIMGVIFSGSKILGITNFIPINAIKHLIFLGGK